MKKKTVTLPALFLSFFVVVGFLLHLITYTTNGLVYSALIAISVSMFGLTKPMIIRALPSQYALIWFGVLFVLWYSYIARYRSNDVLIDVVVITFGFFLILLFSVVHEDYDKALTVILAMSLFFATGVYLQRFLPALYRIVIRVFPSSFQSSLSSHLDNALGIKGFTTNAGFTANYIMVGIFVLISRFEDTIPNRKAIMKLVYLGIALLMTGKRGPLLFLMLSLIFVAIMPARGTKKLKKVWRAFLVVLLLAVMFFTLGSFLEQIPYIGRYFASINGFINGEDITSGRTRLYAWAIQLFIRNPILGIGWGKFRTTVIGNATYTKLLDTHNVYLQLLCETGIIGFLIFVTMFLMSWIMTKNAYCSCLVEDNDELRKWRPALYFSFVFQTYFLLFALTGNPLYDQFYQVIYAFSCSIMVAYRYVASHDRPQLV